MRLYTIIFLLFTARGAFAQAKDSLVVKATTSTQEKTHFIVGALYNSGLNYYGRVDSLHSKAIDPFVGLALKNGLYVNANFVFIENSLQSQYAATLLEGGYNFKNHKGSWSGSLSVSRFFYQQDIDLIQSAVREAASASITQTNKIIAITLGANVKWSNQTDIGVQAGLDHIFRIPHIFGDDVIVLDPTATVYAGTQNFTQTYYQQHNFLIFPGPEQQVTTTSQQFNILAYEFSCPIVYGYKKINFILSPAYVLPQNLIVVPGQPSLSENGANLFYLTAAVKFTL